MYFNLTASLAFADSDPMRLPLAVPLVSRFLVSGLKVNLAPTVVDFPARSLFVAFADVNLFTKSIIR